MILKSFQVDAFSGCVFSGNPASVVLLEQMLPDDLLQKIAMENALPETAFVLQAGDKFLLRWFTPDLEMDLCGHATLAAAHVLFSNCHGDINEIVFITLSGELTVKKEKDGYSLDFPLRRAVKSELPFEIYDSLNIKPAETYKARDYMLVYTNEDDVKSIKIERSTFDKIDIAPGGVIVTAPGKECDFVSRFFTPQATIMEDPVTGSAHCTLAPYWGHRLGKKKLMAMQLSSRGGRLDCEVSEGRVIIIGKAVTYSKSELYI